jgi:hypothetical protein
MDVAIKNPPAAACDTFALPGAYTFQCLTDKVRVSMPDGSIRVFDFAKKLAWILNPNDKTFSSWPLNDFLDSGSKLQQRWSNTFDLKVTTSFKAAEDQETRQVLGQGATPFDVDAESALNRKSASPNFGGLHRGGRRGGGVGGGDSGGTFPGDPGSGGVISNWPSCVGSRAAGQLWLTQPVASQPESGELALSECSVLMPGAAGLARLLDKVRDKKADFLSADLSIQRLDKDGNWTTPCPIVSAEVKSVDHAKLDSSLFVIPSDYRKVEYGPLPNPIQ